jgi:hypothetical protein
MNKKGKQDAVPTSPEHQPTEVREQLQQNDITHLGYKMPVMPTTEDAGNYMGATENNVTQVTPPMQGPQHIIHGPDSDSNIDPYEELTAG